MDRQDLLDRLARRMNLDTLPEPIVEEADDAGLFEDVLKSEVSFEDLLDFARKRMRFYRRMQNYEQRHASSRGKSLDTESFEGTESTSLTRALSSKHDEEERRHVLRASAFEEYLAKLAATERDVYRFRRRFLPDGETISLEEASTLIASPVAACVPATRVRPSVRSLISPLDHNATSDEKQGEDEESPSAPVDLSADPLNEQLSWVVVKQERLLFADKDYHVLEVWVGRLSVLDELRRISARLARVYPWEEAEASRYILTGEPPRVPAVVGRLHVRRDRATTYGTITLTVQPWVPADVVYSFYRDMRQNAFAGSHQTISERKIAVFRFVMAQHEVHPPKGGKPKYSILASPVGPVLRLSNKTRAKLRRKPQFVKPPWKAMLDRWNEQYSDWPYKDEANLKRDFHEAKKTIVHPQYDFQVGE
jgi:hypothetical protein